MLIPTCPSKTQRYTMERLEEVQSLFRQAKDRGFSTAHLENLIRTKQKKLRASTLARIPTVCPALDKDDSGDYDPIKKMTAPDSARARKKRPISNGDEAERELQTSKKTKPTLLAARQQGLQLWVEMPLNFPAGRSLLEKLDDSKNSADSKEPDCLGLSECTDDYTLRSGTATKRSSRSLTGLARKRASTNSTSGNISLCDMSCEPGIDELSARGCRPCHQTAQQCPLINDPNLQWPCKLCKEDGEDCGLFPHAKKRPCESCKASSLICSYSQNNAYHLSCQQCQMATVRCIAGPKLHGTENSDVQSKDSDNTINARALASRKRKFAACSPCRTTKMRCSLRKGALGPCSRCRRAGTECTFDDSNQAMDIDHGGSGVSELRQGGPKQSLDAEIQRLIGSNEQRGASPHLQARTRKITTRWAHPIDFQYPPPDDGTMPCHFCADIKYGMLGLEEKEVEVIDYGPGTGLLEMGGGHRENGVDATRMCCACALGRVHIMNCKKHSIGVTREYDEVTFDEDAAFRALDEGRDTSTYAWCFVCPRPAMYRCISLQTHNKLRNTVTPGSEGSVGCGLTLCITCAEYVEEWDFDLESMLRAMEREGYSGSLRADTEFLLRENDLYQGYQEWTHD